MENKTTPLKSGLKSGIIFGLVLVIFSVILQVAGLQENKPLQYVSYLILLIGVFFGANDFKKNNDGFASYGQAFVSGFITGGIASLISVIYSYIYMTSIDPGFIENIKNEAMIQMEEQGSPEEQIDMALKFMSPGIIAGIALLMFLVFSVIFALIIGAIVKKEKEVV